MPKNNVRRTARAKNTATKTAKAAKAVKATKVLATTNTANTARLNRPRLRLNASQWIAGDVLQGTEGAVARAADAAAKSASANLGGCRENTTHCGRCGDRFRGFCAMCNKSFPDHFYIGGHDQSDSPACTRFVAQTVSVKQAMRCNRCCRQIFANSAEQVRGVGLVTRTLIHCFGYVFTHEFDSKTGALVYRTTARDIEVDDDDDGDDDDNNDNNDEENEDSGEEDRDTDSDNDEEHVETAPWWSRADLYVCAGSLRAMIGEHVAFDADGTMRPRLKLWLHCRTLIQSWLVNLQTTRYSAAHVVKLLLQAYIRMAHIYQCTRSIHTALIRTVLSLKHEADMPLINRHFDSIFEHFTAYSKCVNLNPPANPRVRRRRKTKREEMHNAVDMIASGGSDAGNRAKHEPPAPWFSVLHRGMRRPRNMWHKGPAAHSAGIKTMFLGTIYTTYERMVNSITTLVQHGRSMQEVRVYVTGVDQVPPITPTSECHLEVSSLITHELVRKAEKLVSQLPNPTPGIIVFSYRGIYIHFEEEAPNYPGPNKIRHTVQQLYHIASHMILKLCMFRTVMASNASGNYDGFKHIGGFGAMGDTNKAAAGADGGPGPVNPGKRFRQSGHAGQTERLVKAERAIRPVAVTAQHINPGSFSARAGIPTVIVSSK
jgi:hypothetical protein